MPGQASQGYQANTQRSGQMTMPASERMNATMTEIKNAKINRPAGVGSTKCKEKYTTHSQRDANAKTLDNNCLTMTDNNSSVSNNNNNINNSSNIHPNV
ncbi:unnamed protein product [Ceratitis capitata]|uniref:(Mediterranean fruit fly) hypothetical protein n=1 Tax=Ceratitis capitata TaxID=7213 RepID=A0A811U8B1_CERCA|nr:unnamed protein product [Ceratitis capitata]